jgi:hypothetical protein
VKRGSELHVGRHPTGWRSTFLFHEFLVRRSSGSAEFWFGNFSGSTKTLVQQKPVQAIVQFLQIRQA